MTVLSMSELISRVNANNRRLDSLWASGYFEAVAKRSPDDRGTVINGTLNVQHLKPNSLRLKGEKDIFNDVLDLGTDGENIWLRVPSEGVIYTGTDGRLDPRKTSGLPIRPDLILQVLGVNLLPTDLTAFPAPTLRINPDGRVHMVAFIEPAVLGEQRLKVSREVWYDVPSDPDQPPVPQKVILSDDAGLPVLVATLLRHEPVGGDGGPLVATRYLLYFPQTKGKMRIDLDKLLFSVDARRGPDIPNVRSFRFDASQYPERVESLDFDE